MKIYLVGGAVRDKLLGLPIKERDYVVVGATVNDMFALGFRQVGKEFPVFLHPKTGEEYALARAERKIKPGYTGFIFDTSKKVTLEDDLKRRDLTINAMAEEIETGHIIDPFNGKSDLKNHLLHHVSQAFIEDPVRILRVGRFLARYAHLGFKVHPETLTLMAQMVAKGEVNALVPEHVWKELSRALLERNPEQFFNVLEVSQALPILFPGLIHSSSYIKTLQAASSISQDPEVRFAALFYNYPDKEMVYKRYSVPNRFQKLTSLSFQHAEKALIAPTLSHEEIVDLLMRLDAFRRKLRFKKFLEVTKTIAALKHKSFDDNWLLKALEVAQSVDIKAIIAHKIPEKDLPSKIKAARIHKIKEWLETF